MKNNQTDTYDTRMKRFLDAVALQTPDRIPVIPWNFHFFPAKWANMTFKDAMYDHQRYYDALEEVVLKYDFDMAPDSSVFPAQTWEALGLKYWKWPGHGVPENRVFQYEEHELLSADEYDQFLAAPDSFTLSVLWPRIAKTFEPFGELPPLHHYFNYPHVLGAFFSQPQFADMFKKLITLGEEWKKHNVIQTNSYKKLEELGYPRTYAAVIYPPFDTVSVWLRGLRGSMLDLYRHEDKLLESIDLFTEMQIQSGIAQTKVSGNPRLSLFAYRGADGFMTDEQFKKFYWPSLVKLINALVDEGLMPVLFVEGGFTSRLQYLSDLPKRKIPIHFDSVDRNKAYEAIKDDFCFWGNIPVSLMEHGTPQQVADDVKEIIDIFAGSGGLIVDGAGLITDDTKPENIDAMLDTVHTYGVN